MQDTFALNQSVEPIPAIYFLLEVVEGTQTMSLALVEVSLIVNVILVEADASAFLEIADHFALELQFRKRALANELEDLGS